MNTILAAVDASPCRGPVLQTAYALAELTGATPVALHVGNGAPGPPGEPDERWPCELRVRRGPPVAQIVDEARSPDVIALVIGARGIRRGPRPAGHTALQVITRVAKPVAVVSPDASIARTVRKLFIPLDGTRESSTALADTLALAQREDLHFLVLHVHSRDTVPAFLDHEPYGSSAWDEEFLARHLAGRRDHVTLMRRLGVPSSDVVAVAADSDADLMVLTWSRRLEPGRAQVVAESLAHARIPVLLVPVRDVRGVPGDDLGGAPRGASVPVPDGG